ncbi:MAG: tetratricopeptide repeat protein [Methylocystis sp.]
MIKDFRRLSAQFFFLAPAGAKRNLLARGLVMLLLGPALGLSGCSSTLNDVTASINRSPQPAKLPSDEAGLRRFAEEWGARYDKNPKDKTAAIAYAKALLALKQTSQAMAILQGLAIQYPQDMSVLAAYGKGLASAGQLNQAADVLSRAHTPEKPDWSVVSAQGTIADELGDHVTARRYYDEALKIRPDDPGVLSNLGLSYALSRQLPRAEETLKEAALQPGADMRVRQNLALVLALEGKFDQAEEWSRRDLSPIDAAANVAQIKMMISESNTWRDIQKDAPKEKRVKPIQTSAGAG